MNAQTVRPVIGIPCRLAYDEDWCPPLVGIREGYIAAVIQAGGVPLLLPPHVDPAGLRQMYELLDGLLLAGGGDIAPKLYGEAPHPQLGEVEHLRDAAELPLIRWAVAERKPLLGICRGMQALNVALGGTLYQDIPSQYSTPLDHDSSSQQRSWEHLDHTVAFESDSRLAALLGTCDLQVNTLHHQALKEIAGGLRVVGRAPDGIVEAVEGSGEGFVLGVQCHPEHLWSAADPRWRRVLAAFIGAAAEYAAHKLASVAAS
jgi:putative glutamine amidotransferase